VAGAGVRTVARDDTTTRGGTKVLRTSRTLIAMQVTSARPGCCWRGWRRFHPLGWCGVYLG
jgi:hypothetical protein